MKRSNLVNALRLFTVLPLECGGLTPLWHNPIPPRRAGASKCAVKPPHSKSRHGFTLIELLIVVGIIPIVTGAFALSMIRIGDSQTGLVRRMEAQESSSAVLMLWRNDVAASQNVEIAPSGDRITLAVSVANQKSQSVTYRLTEMGRLTREVTDVQSNQIVKQESFGDNARDLNFQPIGSKGYRMQWTIRDVSGIRRYEWKKGGFAARLK